MTISIVAGAESKRGKGWRSKETLSQSTATSFQSVATYADITVLGIGTATGDVNLYSLGTGLEGIERAFMVTGTGEAKLLLPAGTATGMHTFIEADDFMLCRWYQNKWRVIQSTATIWYTT